STGLFLSLAARNLVDARRNLLTWPLVGLLFAAPNTCGVRTRRRPRKDLASFDTIRSFWRHSRRQDPAAPRS
ncbi:MAG: hypothetical protein IPL58_12865, partial [Betaproteobacteria bacterium]|nr:hypothetical protein [Candidatus Proximibacter danicus]